MLSSITTLFLATLAAAAPTVTPRTTPMAITPVLSQYNVNTGAVTYNTGKGYIYKANGSSPPITTLAKFDFPADSAGKTCTLHFNLDLSPAPITTGSQRVQVFSSLAPATHTTSSWPSGNLRDQHLGDLYLQSGDYATWESTYGPYTDSFPCPAGYSLGAEFVGRWDEVEISWCQTGAEGLYISYA